jgi:ribosomal protein RSM22 (predicted rRNA methylase)
MRIPSSAALARVLAQLSVTKVKISVKLCTPDGIVTEKVPHRDKEPYVQARRWRWDDTAD